MRGIHHVTAIAGKAARNLEFYTRTLGLRLVKRTVNFDDPGTYHLYFGDEIGSPGGILTFFPWAHAAPGRDGTGVTHTTAFRVPEEALAGWVQRLAQRGVEHTLPTRSFGQPVLSFSDPDGMHLALVGIAGAGGEPVWSRSAVAPDQAIRGLHGVTLLLEEGSQTAAVLTGALGFREEGREGDCIRYRAHGGSGGVVDIRKAVNLPAARMGRGSVHHIAFCARDDREQAEIARKLVTDYHLHPTGQKDRQYFRSIYFREPGGVLFEVATLQPGFAVDEPLADLGNTLKLPPFLEPRRRELEAVLPSLEPLP